ncbi:hypothetical protein E2C01_092222 [Portunus trituberculatus]|uniref:Uncharacterized protein n=1 Tax=Portunus trituberculatus TaxID=210409 RepID=A0A5B7JJJ4_PORTR|nr:hypothetical protein [Portunus trituberculatus]
MKALLYKHIFLQTTKYQYRGWSASPSVLRKTVFIMEKVQWAGRRTWSCGIVRRVTTTSLVVHTSSRPFRDPSAKVMRKSVSRLTTTTIEHHDN